MANAAAGPQRLTDIDGGLLYYREFYRAERARELFKLLRAQLAWHGEKIKIFGKHVAVPRLVCWYGDERALYTYSGVRHQPLAWTPLLLEIKRDIEHLSGLRFNSVLGNLYRDGNDSMGWHADKEAELGGEPQIASLSLGAPRMFKTRHNKNKDRVDVMLDDGSLLLMSGAFQRNWRHAIPKTRQPVGERINLTFRFVYSRDD